MNYNNQKTVIACIQDYGKLVKETIDIIPTLPPIEAGHLYNTSEPGRLIIRAPYNFVEYRKFRCALGASWKRTGKAMFSESLGSLWVGFQHTETGVGLDLELTFPRDAKGAAYHVVEAGKVTRPVYKLARDD